MPRIAEVKHSAEDCAVRKKSKSSHPVNGVLRVKMSLNGVMEKDNNGYSLTYNESGRFHSAFGFTLKIRSFKIALPSGDVHKATMQLWLNGCVSYSQSISIDDFRALFHAFKPEQVNDELNLLSTSEEEVIATSTDQVPVAGTNNA